MKNLWSISKILIAAPLFILSNFNLCAQSVSVIVEDEMPLTFDVVDVTVSLTTISYDYDVSAYDFDKPKEYSKEEYLAELDIKNIKHTLINTRIDSIEIYERSTKKTQTKIRTEYQYQLQLENKQELEDFKNFRVSNAKIFNTEYKVINDKETLSVLAEQLIKKAKIEADVIANVVDRKTTDILNIKVISQQTNGKDNPLMLYELEKKAYLALEVTFDTIPNK